MRLGSFTHESVTEPYDDGEADSSRLRTQSLSSAVGRAKNAKEQYSFDLPIRKSKVIHVLRNLGLRKMITGK